MLKDDAVRAGLIKPTSKDRERMNLAPNWKPDLNHPLAKQAQAKKEKENK